MADKKYDLPGEKYPYEKDYRADLDAHDQFITEWDGNEAMLVSKTYDAVSKQTKNGITDSEAATMVIERSARVVGQLPDGEVTAAGRKDRGKALFMDILRQKWIYPNANAQRPFLDKIRLWEMYSGVYGVMPMYYDWYVSRDYVGPNCWLWNPRNLIPQQGRYTIEDMDYVHAISWMTKREIDDLIADYDPKKSVEENGGWVLANLKTLSDAVENASKDQDSHRDTYVERQRQNQAVKGRIQVITRYESGYYDAKERPNEGRWCTFAPDYAALNLREIPNPHKNGKIPFVLKPGIPLFDSFYNLSEMSRAKPIQFAKDGLTNFYFQGIKINIYPPTVVNAQGILKHTVSNEPGAIWEEIIPNSARRLETSTAGLATYQTAMGILNGSLQNVFGSTTTQLNQETADSPQFGKTPEAIKYQQGRESARDNQNRAYLQSSIETLMDRFFELIVNIGTEYIPVDLFAKDILEIKKAGHGDVMNLILPNESKQTGRLIINPKALAGVTYRFNMAPDSTVKADKEQQRQSLVDFMQVLGAHQNELQEIQKQTGKSINWQQLIDAYGTISDVPGLEDLFVQGPIPPQDNNPVMRVLENLNIKFESLPEDAQRQILAMTLGVQSQGVSPTQQNIDIKQQEADAKNLKALSDILSSHAQQPEQPLTTGVLQTPGSINGRLFQNQSTNTLTST